MLAATILVSGFGCAVSIWLAQDRIDRQTRAEETEVAELLSPEDWMAVRKLFLTEVNSLNNNAK
ncbi:MAG: hypothetical protein NT154_04470 [Verrucomicrobia bacterium]|nr:hypothetical protein [Verrucomicrobiota bacterium]